MVLGLHSAQLTRLFLFVLCWYIANARSNHSSMYGWISTEIEQVITDPQSCELPWPELEIMVNILVSSNASDLNYAARKSEWKDVFLRTYALFWPLKRSKTKLMLMFDEESRDSVVHADINAELAKYAPALDYSNVRKVFNSPPPEYYQHSGWVRQQYVMFYADNFTSSEYVGFADTDTMFTTFIDRSDIFANGSKPVINGKTGDPFNRGQREHELYATIMKTTYEVMGLLNPMKCMSYFPVVFKLAHIIAFRKYLENRHGMPFYEIMKVHISKQFFGQFNMICTYVFHYHREEYMWFVHDVTPGWDYSTAFYGQLNHSNFFTPEMYYPKPRVAIHTRYHYAGITGDSAEFYAIVQAGLCYSRPVYADMLHEHCAKFLPGQFENGTYFSHMYTFEKFRFYQVYQVEHMQRALKSRHKLITTCFDKHPPQVTTSKEVIDDIFRQTGLRNNIVVGFFSTGKVLFWLYNGILFEYTNWERFVNSGGDKFPRFTLNSEFETLYIRGPNDDRMTEWPNITEGVSVYE